MTSERAEQLRREQKDKKISKRINSFYRAALCSSLTGTRPSYNILWIAKLTLLDAKRIISLKVMRFRFRSVYFSFMVS